MPAGLELRKEQARRGGDRPRRVQAPARDRHPAPERPRTAPEGARRFDQAPALADQAARRPEKLPDERRRRRGRGPGPGPGRGGSRSAGRIYYVTDGRAYTWREITDAVAEEIGVRRFHLPIPFPVQYLVAAASEAVARIRKKAPLVSRAHVLATRRYCWVYDGSRIGRELGFEGKADMKAAVRAAVAWSRAGGKD